MGCCASTCTKGENDNEVTIGSNGRQQHDAPFRPSHQLEWDRPSYHQPRVDRSHIDRERVHRQRNESCNARELCYMQDIELQQMEQAQKEDRKPLNDFHRGIKNNTNHERFMHTRKRYQISVYRYGKFTHHVIVISDGENEDIIFGLTVNAPSKWQAIAGEERAIAEVRTFEDDRSHLEVKGKVVCTLYELAEKAGMIIDSNRQYNLLSNNCQSFCNKFLEENGLPTYITDVQSAGMFATGTAAVLSIFGYNSSARMT